MCCSFPITLVEWVNNFICFKPHLKEYAIPAGLFTKQQDWPSRQIMLCKWYASNIKGLNDTPPNYLGTCKQICLAAVRFKPPVNSFSKFLMFTLFRCHCFCFRCCFFLLFFHAPSCCADKH